ncbi:MAG: substrate-binding domain-containing protein [Selenomonadaceae bacterium]|nr:substrate-binding domain-containing protein [Selenomonadaceae bacterium]
MGRLFFRALCIAILLLPLLFSAGCGGNTADVVVREDTTAPPKQGAEEYNYKIYLITMDQASNYWQHIDSGCRKAVREIGGIDYHWIAPVKNNIADQRECIDRAVESGAHAILLSASSPTELEGSLANATQAGIKLIYVDSTATHEAIASLVTDNEAAGKTAGKIMQKALAEAGITKGTIGVATGNSWGKNAKPRYKGFQDAFEGTEFTVAPPVAMDGNRKNIEEEVATHPEYVAFFGANEQTTRIMSEQIQSMGRKQIIIGFDTSDFTLSMIQQGIIYATIQQNPERMGYEGVSIAVSAMKGEYAPSNANEDMGVTVITRDKI